MSLAERIRAITAVDPETGKEMALATLQQFLLTRMPMDAIAARMGISVRYVKALKAQLRERVRKDIRAMDVHALAGDMLAQFDEAAAIGFREAAAAVDRAEIRNEHGSVVQSGLSQWQRRLKGVEVAMRALTDKARLLQLAGAFDGAPLRAAIVADDDEADSANVLKQLATAFLTGSYDRDDQVSIPAGSQIIDVEAD